MSNSKKPLPVTPNSAQRLVMDMISRREHSEVELRDKLRQKEFSIEEIESALEKAKEKKWITSPEQASQSFAELLHRKNKGIEFINSQLQEKGLPAISRDENLELEKAESLMKTKYSRFSEFSEVEKTKVMRFLASRGFDSSTIQKVLNVEEF